MKLIEPILADAPAIAKLRRDLHAHPELCFHEDRTSDLIAQALSEWGIPVHRGLGKTGVVGTIHGRDGDYQFIEMEYLAGGSLAELLKDGPYKEVRFCAEWLRQAAQGLLMNAVFPRAASGLEGSIALWCCANCQLR